MVLNKPFAIRDRKQAGFLLAQQLTRFKDSAAIVLGVPYGGAVVGYHLADALNLPFDVIACKAIPHPGDPRQTIGSISPSEVVIHDQPYDIPGDYIYRQVMRNQNRLKTQQAYYHSFQKEALAIENADVIVVGDIIKTADAVIAALRALNRQSVRNIIVAASIVTPDAVRQLAPEVDEVVALLTEDEVQPTDFYEEKSVIRDRDIRGLVLKSLPN